MRPARRLLRFGVVGAVGFAVDGGLLWALVAGGADPYLARGLSFPVAVLATWALNRAWTFEDAARSRPAAQLRRYLGVQVAGAACNYAVYAAWLALAGQGTAQALAGFAAGSALGMVVNFLGARALVFRP